VNFSPHPPVFVTNGAVSNSLVSMEQLFCDLDGPLSVLMNASIGCTNVGV